ncbi:MAG: 2Fe-2S iron-sulfur cluster binding domain-containing protein [Pyrinomonadaceae bacterium]|nr:2Fe-2S iron-sulfur cluster binding domain-containing protein [Pyrinomonadaceae bacterium]
MKDLNEGFESYDIVTHEDEMFLTEELTEDEEKLLDELGIHGTSRRKFLGQVGAAGFGMLALQVIAQQETLGAEGFVNAAEAAPTSVENAVKVSMRVNGKRTSIEVDTRMTLLDTLRERLGLTGSKKGCDHGQCGACTVHIDGRRELSCLTLAATCEDKDVTTIEGIASGETLHPVQAAFIKHDAFQCGYCTPGQICSAVALLDEAKQGEVSHATENVSARSRPLKLSDDEIRERMSGNLCRCGAYPNILKAVKEVHTGEEIARTWNFAERIDDVAEVRPEEDVKDETI